ncbi:transcriptional regulator, MerR family [Denitrovibrio acetiphilus DSM 12809]|uniref:Transcriptional regulator, MerR family n=1 Tax=Denitrovibrio acetiphilus (strain DSM 12809 / NBRC 114555 / N2460) TaxID=522772 RepID=D4H151_DENA2|nr:MerR family transcriptional regulator [Denitrovibrio acetiphilus]ADD68714.1 transcriptional regulator, MerR family [Denitrovibrio acetiphilus DSM 12809]
MKLKINDIAKLFDCTTEAIRYYEKEGILVPERDPENNYRYYTVQHLKLLAKCAFLRSADFSVKEITEIMTEGTINNIGQRMADKELELVKESERLLRISQTLANCRKKIESIPSKLNTFTVTENPEFIYLINQHNKNIYQNYALSELISKWLKNFPEVKLCVLVKQEDLIQKDSLSRYHGYGVQASLVDVQKFEQAGLSKRLKPRKCLYTIQAFTITKESRLASTRLMMDYIKQNNYIVNGDMFGTQLFIDQEYFLDPDIPKGNLYYEYWIPIE